MSLTDKELKPLVCCIPNCGRTLKVVDGNQAVTSGWDLEEDGEGRTFDLCPACKGRQACQDERSAQRLGLPPKDVAPAIKVEKASDQEIREAQARIERGEVSLSPSALNKPSLPLDIKLQEKVNQSNITIMARFKLIALEVVCGNQVISNIELTPEIKAKLKISEEICQVL
jgi:hypothetical protein